MDGSTCVMGRGECIQVEHSGTFPSPLLQGGSKRKVIDIFEDLKDGLILMDLVKIFTGVEPVGDVASPCSFVCVNSVMPHW